MQGMIYRSSSELDFVLDDIPQIVAPARVLLTTPTFFEVSYVINPHMAGNVGSVDRDAARSQWNVVGERYRDIGVETLLVDGAENLPDMVFCANQTLPYCTPDGEIGVVLSRMHADERAGEVSRYRDYFTALGYAVRDPLKSTGLHFEGMGDAIWHPGRYLLWGGFGFRTEFDAYDKISTELDVRILAIELDDPEFYHLDTCFCVLSPQHVLIYPGVFDKDALGLIHRFFPTVLEAPENESRDLFACNAHCPDGKHVIIQRGCIKTNELLREAGFIPVETDTSEFLKAGGSVFCMKQMLW